MPVTAIVGTQWGDEGKGRMTDLLASNADAVIRFQGGANAGHTVVNEHGKFALHMLPCGVFRADCLNILGTGMIVNLESFVAEMQMFGSGRLSKPRVMVSDRAHVHLPVYREIERALDQSEGALKYGSTARGIAPAYASKAAKIGLQVSDLAGDPGYIRERLYPLFHYASALLRGLSAKEPSMEENLEYVLALREAVLPYVGDVVPVIRELLNSDAHILVEGQLGTLRDLDWGIYPYATSSNPLAGYSCVGAGVPPQSITKIYGIMKCYSSCVGTGPFVSELQGPMADHIRETGKEYGAATGRPRRIGWFDVVASRHGAWLQGATSLCLTLLDVLSDLDEIPVCTEYSVDGILCSDLPAYRMLTKARPVYRTLPGWKTPIQHVRNFDDLPSAAKDYVNFISDSIGVPVSHISVGPERNDIIVLESERAGTFNQCQTNT